MATALSFESIKKYEGQDIRLEIKNLTIYADNKRSSVQTIWPLSFNLKQSSILERETIKLNREFTFKNETYKVKQVEFSELETRVVVTGTDIKLQTDENGLKYEVMSKLEHKFLNARKIDKEYGYIVDDNKSGVFLISNGKRIEPIFIKGEIPSKDNEYVMVFGPIKEQEECILKVGEHIKIPLSK